MCSVIWFGTRKITNVAQKSQLVTYTNLLNPTEKENRLKIMGLGDKIP